MSRLNTPLSTADWQEVELVDEPGLPPGEWVDVTDYLDQSVWTQAVPTIPRAQEQVYVQPSGAPLIPIGQAESPMLPDSRTGISRISGPAPPTLRFPATPGKHRPERSLRDAYEVPPFIESDVVQPGPRQPRPEFVFDETDPDVQAAMRGLAEQKMGDLERSALGRVVIRAANRFAGVSVRPIAQILNFLAQKVGIDSAVLQTAATDLEQAIPPPESKPEALASAAAEIGGMLTGLLMPGSIPGKAAKGAGKLAGKLVPKAAPRALHLGAAGAGGVAGFAAGQELPRALSEGEPLPEALGRSVAAPYEFTKGAVMGVGEAAQLLGNFARMTPKEVHESLQKMEPTLLAGFFAVAPAVTARFTKRFQRVTPKGEGLAPPTREQAMAMTPEQFVREFPYHDPAVMTEHLKARIAKERAETPGDSPTAQMFMRGVEEVVSETKRAAERGNVGARALLETEAAQKGRLPIEIPVAKKGESEKPSVITQPVTEPKTQVVSPPEVTSVSETEPVTERTPKPPAKKPIPRTPPAEEHYLDNLQPEVRERALAQMRRMRDQSDSYLERSRKYSPRTGEIPVGGAANEAFERGEAIATYLRSLSRGRTPDQALADAKAFAREAIAKGNRIRGTESKRSPEGEDPFLEGLHRQFIDTVGEKPATPTKEPWQMTKAEFLAERGRLIDEYKRLSKEHGGAPRSMQVPEVKRAFEAQAEWGDIEIGHRPAVQRAHKAGKPIPPEVLAEYPELEKKAEPLAPKEEPSPGQALADKWLKEQHELAAKGGEHVGPIARRWAERIREAGEWLSKHPWTTIPTMPERHRRPVIDVLTHLDKLYNKEGIGHLAIKGTARTRKGLKPESAWPWAKEEPPKPKQPKKPRAKVTKAAAAREVLEIAEARGETTAAEKTKEDEPLLRSGYSFSDSREGRMAAKELKERLPKHLQMKVRVRPKSEHPDGEDVMSEIGTDAMANAIIERAGKGQTVLLRRMVDQVEEHPEQFSPLEAWKIRRYAVLTGSPEGAEIVQKVEPEEVTAGDLHTGDTFEIFGVKHTVGDTSGGEVTIANDVHEDLPAAKGVIIDKGTLKRAAPKKVAPIVKEKPKDLLGQTIYESETGKQTGFEFGFNVKGERVTEQGVITKEGKLKPDVSKAAEEARRKEDQEAGQLQLPKATETGKAIELTARHQQQIETSLRNRNFEFMPGRPTGKWVRLSGPPEKRTRTDTTRSEVASRTGITEAWLQAFADAEQAEQERRMKAVPTATSTEVGTKEATPLPVAYTRDIPEDIARAAHMGTSMVPEKRGQSEQSDYVSMYKDAVEELKPLARSAEQQALLASELTHYLHGLRQRFIAKLQAQSRVMSTMITGPSNFPTARNRKRGDIADKRRNELFDFQERAIQAIKRKLRQATSPEQAAADEAARLKKEAMELLATMKGIESGKLAGFDRTLFKAAFVGKLERSTDPAAIQAALDLVRAEQKKLKKPIFTERHKVWTLAKEAEKTAALPEKTGTETVAAFEGGTIVRNFDADRVQIDFKDKPDEKLRAALKSEGWRWAPRDKVWQRKNTLNAVESAKRITGVRKELEGLPKLSEEKPPAEKPKGGGTAGGEALIAPLSSTAGLTAEQAQAFRDELPRGEANPFDPVGRNLKPPREGFNADLMAAAKALAVPARSKALRGLMLGVFRHGPNFLKLGREKIEVRDVRWSITLAHELGHAIDWRVNGDGFPSSILKRFPGLGLKEKEARAELKTLSEVVRPFPPGLDWSKTKTSHVKYRAKHQELMADLFAMMAHDLPRARRLAPTVTDALLSKINANDTVKASVDMVLNPEMAELAPVKLTSKGLPPPTPLDPMEQALGEPDPESRALVWEWDKELQREYSANMFRTRMVANRWRRTLSEKERHDVGAMVERVQNFRYGGTAEEVKSRATPEMRAILRDFPFEQELNRQEVNKLARQAGVTELLSYIEDYLAHLYKNKDKIRRFAARWTTQTKHAKRRVFPTLADAAEAGLEPLTQDVAYLYEKTAELNFKAALTRVFVKRLRSLRHTMTGEKLVVPTLDEAGPDWVRIEHNALRHVFARKDKSGATHLWHNFAYVHPSIAHPVQVILDRPFRGPIARAYVALNSLGKALNVGFSFFHGVALLESGQAELIRTYNPFRGLVIGPFESKRIGLGFRPQTAWGAGVKLAEKDPAGVEDAIRHGLNIGPQASLDYVRSRMEQGLEKIEDATKRIPGLHALARIVRRAQETLNAALWDNIHVGLKLFSYHTIVAEELARAPVGMSAKEVKEAVAKQVNNAFGGQEFIEGVHLVREKGGKRRLRVEPMGPKGIQVAHGLIFAPDWTISNLKVAGDPIIGRNKVQRRLGLRYWRNMGFVAAVELPLVQAILWLLMGDDDMEPWMWNNSPGHRWDIDVTPIKRAMPWHDPKDKSRYYVRPLKQAKEVLRYFAEWPDGLFESLGNKLAVIPRTVIEQVSSHSAGTGFPMEWTEDRENLQYWQQTWSRAKAVGENWVPFSFSPTNFAFSLPLRKGMTRYKAMRYFEQAMRTKVSPSMLQKVGKRIDPFHKSIEQVISDVAAAMRTNGFNDDEIKQTYRNARSRVRTDWYEKLFQAIEDNDVDKINRAGEALRDLGVLRRDVESSARNRQSELPREIAREFPKKSPIKGSLPAKVGQSP